MSDGNEFYLHVTIPKSDGFHTRDDQHMASVLKDIVDGGLKMKSCDALGITVTVKPVVPDPVSGPVVVHEDTKPSRFTAAPEDIDAWLHEGFAEDRLLVFYQWVGQHAVREALDDIKRHLGDDPVPVEHRSYDPQAVEGLLDVVNPDAGPIALPSVLPKGKPFCDVDRHAHTHGGSRLPSCRLDSPGEE